MSNLNIVDQEPNQIITNLDANSRAKVCIVVKNSLGKFLLLKRRPDEIYPNIWECPGGKRDGDEALEVTVVRELEEETGIVTKVDNIRYLFTSSFYEDFSNKTVYVFYFVVESDENPTHIPEHVEWKWFEKGEAVEQIPFEGPKRAVDLI